MSLNSYMSLDILNSTSNPLPFKITKALIKESYAALNIGLFIISALSVIQAV